MLTLVQARLGAWQNGEFYRDRTRKSRCQQVHCTILIPKRRGILSHWGTVFLPPCRAVRDPACQPTSGPKAAGFLPLTRASRHQPTQRTTGYLARMLQVDNSRLIAVALGSLILRDVLEMNRAGSAQVVDDMPGRNYSLAGAWSLRPEDFKLFLARWLTRHGDYNLEPS